MGRNADAAMYSAKASGRNRVLMFEANKLKGASKNCTSTSSVRADIHIEQAISVLAEPFGEAQESLVGA